MFPYLISHIMDRISRSSSYLFLTLTLTLSFAYAGEYHAIKEKTKINQEVLACSQCHTMHGTQGNASLIYDKYGVSTGVYTKLLRQATILQLCLYCHDGNTGGVSPTPPDIWGTTAGQTNPSGGSLCSGSTDNATPPCSDITTNHTVGAAGPIPIPGTSPAVNLTEFTCVNCHNPHGTTSYRNLRDNGTTYAGITFMAAGETITYSMNAARDNTKYVNNLVAADFGLAKYETSNVVFKKVPVATAPNTDANKAGIQGFCKSCHTLFHGAGGDAATVGGAEPTTPWTRHPTRDTNIATAAAATNLHADLNCWTTGTTAGGCAEAFNTTGWNRVIDPDVTDENNGTAVPFCLTCHRAHGSTRHSNLIYGGAALSTRGDLDPTEAGWSSRMMRSTCQQCHNQ